MKMKQKSIGNPITKKVLVLTLILMSFIGMAGSVQAEDEVMEVDITVTPSTLVFNDNGNWVTVHADIAHSAVERNSIKLNNVDVYRTEADADGFLVAQFYKSDFIGLDPDENVPMTLKGNLIDEDGIVVGTFSGTDYIQVIIKQKTDFGFRN